MGIFSFSYQFLGYALRSILHYPSTKKEIIDFLRLYQLKNKDKFDDKLIKDVVKRHIIQQLFINDAFVLLKGRKSNTKEHQRNILFTIVSCIYDTIIDEEMMTVPELDNMLSYPELHQCIGFYDTALKDAYLKLLSLIGEKESFKNVIRSVHQAQIDSLKQHKADLSMDEIIAITKRKGGYSLLAAQYLLDVPHGEEMSSCWYELGSLVQMMDDLYDIHEDLLKGISTFSNSSSKFIMIKEIYDRQVNEFNKAIKNLGVSDHKKEEFKVCLSLIPSLGYVALDNLAKNLVAGDQLPDLTNLPRAKLITDMEKFSNRIKLIQYCFRFSKMG